MPAAVTVTTAAAPATAAPATAAPPATRPAATGQSVNWSQSRFDAGHDGFNPYERYLGPGNAATLQPRWADQLTTAFLEADPAIVNGVAYVNASDGYLYAVDAATGKVLWRGHTGGYGSSSAAVANGTVYVGTVTGLMAFPAACSTPCKPRWTAAAWDTMNYAPSYANGTVYVGGYRGRLYAIDAATGKIKWHGTVNPSSRVDPNPVFGSPSVAGGIVYVAANNGLMAFPASCTSPCRPLWTVRMRYGMEVSPAISGGIAYAPEYDGTVFAVDAVTGSVKWVGHVGAVPDTPAVGDGEVFVADQSGNLASFPVTCSARCKPAWRAPTGRSMYGPVVANHVVYSGSLDTTFKNGLFYAFPAKCSTPCVPLLQLPVSGAIESSPAVTNHTVYIGTLSGMLYALHPTGGHPGS